MKTWFSNKKSLSERIGNLSNIGNFPGKKSNLQLFTERQREQICLQWHNSTRTNHRYIPRLYVWGSIGRGQIERRNLLPRTRGDSRHGTRQGQAARSNRTSYKPYLTLPYLTLSYLTNIQKQSKVRRTRLEFERGRDMSLMFFLPSPNLPVNMQNGQQVLSRDM